MRKELREHDLERGRKFHSAHDNARTGWSATRAAVRRAAT